MGGRLVGTMDNKTDTATVEDLFNEFDVVTEDIIEMTDEDKTPTDNMFTVVEQTVVEVPEPPTTSAEPTVPLSQFNEVNDKFLRLYADFENFKKRATKERQDHTKFATENLLREFLPVLDNLTRAVASARKSGEAPTIAAGIDMVTQEFLKVLKRAGIEPISVIGLPFDPSFHEALQQIETDSTIPGTVAVEILPGYLLNGRVLRPALVGVAKAPEKTHSGDESA